MEDGIIRAIKKYRMRQCGDIICNHENGAEAHLIAEVLSIVRKYKQINKPNNRTK